MQTKAGRQSTWTPTKFTKYLKPTFPPNEFTSLIVIQMFLEGSGTVWVGPKGTGELSLPLLSRDRAGFLTDDVLRNYSLLKL